MANSSTGKQNGEEKKEEAPKNEIGENKSININNDAPSPSTLNNTNNNNNNKNINKSQK